MSLAAAALAYELGNHVDELVDRGETALATPDGEEAGTIADTLTGTNDGTFLVQTEEGALLEVTVTEIEKPVEPKAAKPAGAWVPWGPEGRKGL